MLVDSHGRKMDYLRIAITDRCNFRCRYCMPEEGIDFLSREELLTYEEMLRLGKIFKDLGVKKVRITGGEPFVRKDIDVLLKSYSELFPSLNITTNATLLHHHWNLIEELGLKGLNISIDSLQEEKFNQITRRKDFKQVLQNINDAHSMNLPVKLNVVIMKGINDDEILDFIQFGLDHGIEIRFIEAMPFNEDDGNKNQFLPYTEIKSRIESVYGPLSPLEDNLPSSSLKYSIGEDLTVGLIPSYSRSLCGSCNRIRLTPQGQFLTCLYAAAGIDLKAILRNGATDQELCDWIISAVAMKEKDGFIEENKRIGHVFQSMTSIGG